MPRNGSGTYSLPEPPFVAGTVISSTAVNDDLSDIADALTGSVPRDGQAGMLGQLKLTDGNAIAPSLSFNNDINTGIYRPADDELAITVGGVQVALFTSNGLQGALPIGTVLDFAGATVPSLFILCYGQNVPRTTFAALFAIIGTTYGSGDGVTTFGLPDLRGTIVAGKDNMGGVAAGYLSSTYYGADPTVLGTRGGSQSKQLISSNLPAYTPAGSVSGTFTSSQTGIPLNAVAFGAQRTDGFGTGIVGPGGATIPVTTGAATGNISATFTGSAQGGTSVAFAVVNPALIMNKIIYAGA